MFSNPDSLRPSFTQTNEHRLPETDQYRYPSHSGFFNNSYSGTGYQGSGSFSGPTQQGNVFYSGDYTNSGSNFPSAGSEDFNSLNKQNKNFYSGFINSLVNQGASGKFYLAVTSATDFLII